eukprot:1215440-Amphidinium_carterae.1
MKFRDDIQTRFGNDLDQRIRKQIEQYVTAASGAERGIRIELYANALKEIKDSQTLSDQRCKAAEDKCNRLVTEHLDTVARLEKTVRDLLAQQVKDQRDHTARPTGRGRSRGESGSPRTVRQASRTATPDSEGYLGGSPAPMGPTGVKLRQSHESTAFSLKANRESPSLGEVATDTEGSWIEEIFLEPVRRSLVGEAERGATKVYTTDDRAFKLNDIVIFQDLHHNVEAHQVAGYGSLILDGPLRSSYPPGSEVRTLMGTERVYSNGTHFWIGNAGGVDYIAPLYGPSVAPRTPEHASTNQQGGTPPQVPKFGASQQDSGAGVNPETPSPGRGTTSTASPGTFGTPEAQGSTPQTGSGSPGASGSHVGASQTSPGNSQVRDVSPPVSASDESHSDQAKAFLGKDVTTFLKEHNIRQTTNSGHDPKANGLAERWVGLIKARTTSTLIHTKLGPDFWPFACQYVAMCHNARVLNTPGMNNPVFGEAVVYSKPVDKPDAFTGRGEVGVFLGWHHNISHGAYVMVDVGGEWDTVKTAKIRELKTKDVWRLTRDDEDPTKVVYVNQKGDATWAPPMDKLNTVEEFEFKGPYTEYSVKKLSPGWAWWYQPLSEVMPEAESIRLARSEREHSYGEDNLAFLECFGEQEDDKKTDHIQVVFPEATSGKDRKTLSVAQIQEAGTSGSRVGVPVEAASDLDVDQESNQAALQLLSHC